MISQNGDSTPVSKPAKPVKKVVKKKKTKVKEKLENGSEAATVIFGDDECPGTDCPVDANGIESSRPHCDESDDKSAAENGIEAVSNGHDVGEAVEVNGEGAAAASAPEDAVEDGVGENGCEDVDANGISQNGVEEQGKLHAISSGS